MAAARDRFAKQIAFEKAVFPWAANGRSLTLGRDEGLTKILFDQDYAKDNKQSVGKVLSDAGLTVRGFARFKVGA